MSDTIARPPYDAELEQVLITMADRTNTLTPETLTPGGIRLLREERRSVPIDDLLEQHRVTRRDVTIPGYGNDEIVVSIFQRGDHTGAGPGLYHIHGGGMIMGDRTSGAPIEWISRFDAVCVSVEYRLAPEHQDPIPVEDCYAGLVWTAEHAPDLGIDPDQLVIMGISAGGGLAAGAALMARDRQGPKLLAQLLDCPMLDDRDATTSARQFEGVGVWDRGSNNTGWRALLGERVGTHDVSNYTAPARASDLSGLPPAYIGCGSAEVFRDENVAYASSIWAAGGQAELHVFAGAFHWSDGSAPAAVVSRASAAARDNWIMRTLGRPAAVG